MSVYLGTNCIDFLKINKNKEREKTVKFIDYDGTILHEYSKDEFLALSSMPANPTGIKPLSGAIITDPCQNYFEGITDSEGKIYYEPASVDSWADYPNIKVNDERLYPTLNTQTDNIVSDFLQDMFDNAGLEGTYHNETDVFVINGNSYKLITEATPTTGYLQILKTNLVPQGWNWSLSDAKAYVQKWDYLNIGQMYITQSGDTEIDIYFHENSVRLSPYLGIAINGTVEIDWGDNSTHSTVTGTSLTTQIRTQHTYSQPGNYTIKIHVNSGNFAFYCSSDFTLLNANKNNSNVSYNVVYSSIVKNIRIGENCSIGSDAFSNCYSLQSVTIPSGVTSINDNAFKSCYSLKSVTIPDGVTAIKDGKWSDGYVFSYCYSLNSITIPNTVTSIGGSAFYNCSSLQSITIPNTVTSIGSNVFYGCYSLNTRVISSKVVYKSNYYLNNNITSIDKSAFQNCYSLKSITIPDTVTSIGTYAFDGCYSLQSITIPDGVTSINGYTFRNCHSLQSVTIPNTVTSIGSYAFEFCRSLHSIIIPNTVTSIGSYAFSNCSSLQSVTIPSGVTSINDNAFKSCYSLQSVTIPSGVTSIKYDAFENCYSLQSITIPEGVTSIGGSAFYNCSSLNSVSIPSTVTSIGDSAFYSCYGMKKVHLKPTTPPTLGVSAFSNIPSDCIIYVPQGTLSDYQSASKWSTYASKMQEESN